VINNNESGGILLTKIIHYVHSILVILVINSYHSFVMIYKGGYLSIVLIRALVTEHKIARKENFA